MFSWLKYPSTCLKLPFSLVSPPCFAGEKPPLCTWPVWHRPVAASLRGWWDISRPGEATSSKMFEDHVSLDWFKGKS